MNIALLGYTQSGKKTLFELLTARQIPESALHEGKALEGLARVHDERLEHLNLMVSPEKMTSAETQVVSCPDITSGATDRQWLDAAQRCDVLCLLIRAFDADDVYHPLGSVDAARDRANLNAELILADLGLVETRIERLDKDRRRGLTSTQEHEYAALLKCKDQLEQERYLSSLELEPHHSDALRSLGLLTRKPLLWAYNVAEDAVADDAPEPGAFVVSCLIEKEIAQIEEMDERRQFLEDCGLSSTGGERLNAAAYSALGLISYYTQGPTEVRAWTVVKGTSAPAAAGKIHSDLERGFIRVEVITFDDFVACGGESEAKAAGKMQLRGKDYTVEDGDVCLFRFNV
ncbi:MAG: DUF933 domain-containing protein [Verrucomicrobia bacterium]|nr:DUF933 domain-containing protein [Verrucomicrobiota bacterium]MDA1087434.1 DUF933 domain-containing protein [Verrucomicrobiota bacterium]